MYERLPIYVCARMNTRVQSCVSEKAGVTSTLPACRNGSHTFNVATVSPVLTFKKRGEEREKQKQTYSARFTSPAWKRSPLSSHF